MKTATFRNTMIAVAALAVAGTASAQQSYRAEIPLTFRAGNTTMLPGAYRIDTRLSANGSQLIYFSNLDTHQNVIVLTGPATDAPTAWKEKGLPVIEFKCVEDSCTASKLWSGGDEYAYSLPQGSHKGEGKIALVTLKRNR
jgi:hypothetical protein